MDPELQALIQKGIAAGYSDEDIKLLGEEYQRRKTAAPAQSQLTGLSHATTIQADPSSALKRGIDTALYEAKGVPGIVAGGMKNIVGGANAVLGLVHAPQIPLDTEASNQDQRLGDAAATVASLAPAGTAVEKGAEVAAPLITRVAQKAAPVVGGIAGAAEGYRRRGIIGAVEGAMVGTAGGGILGRIVRKTPLTGVETATSKAATTAKVAEEGAAALREASRINESGVTPQSIEAYLHGRVSTPPVSESLRSQGESLLSPDAQQLRESLAIATPPKQVETSRGGLSDLIKTPEDLNSLMRVFYAENESVPIKRRVHVPQGAEITANDLRPRTLEEAYRLIVGKEPPAGGPSVLEIGRTRGGGPVVSPTRPPNPNAGGRLITTGRMNPSTALDMALSGSPRGFEAGDTANVHLPEQIQPPVFLSPKARAATGHPPSQLETLEDVMRQREQTEAYNRYNPQLTVVEPSAVQQTRPSMADVQKLSEPLKAPAKAAPAKRPRELPALETAVTPSADDALYYRLRVKPHLTGEEQAVFNKLEAKRRGTAYAAGRNPDGS